MGLSLSATWEHTEGADGVNAHAISGTVTGPPRGSVTFGLSNSFEPTSAWPGHADPLTGDVRAQLVHAAETA